MFCLMRFPSDCVAFGSLIFTIKSLFCHNNALPFVIKQCPNRFLRIKQLLWLSVSSVVMHARQ